MLFDYSKAFSRNIGLISPVQQLQLKKARVAIAGLGGVGGDYLISLVRAGIQSFHIADSDSFELANLNRQYGANMSTVGHKKNETLMLYAKDINPDLNIKCFECINNSNLDTFLDSCDLVIDAIDLFEVDTHKILIETCQNRGITVLAAIPLGWTVSYISFSKDSMSFREYFGFKSHHTQIEKILRFSLGFSPGLLHLNSIDRQYVNLIERKGPSSVGSCKLCSGVVVIQAIKFLLGLSHFAVAPKSLQFDGMTFKINNHCLWWGARNPLFKLKLFVARKIFA